MEVYYARALLVGVGILLIPFAFSGLVIWSISPGTSGGSKNLPRTLPYKFPLLKSTISFAFDGHDFFRYAS